jgi:hypothetical protein
MAMRKLLMMKRAVVFVFFAAVFTGLCAAQSMFRNFHQEGPASQEINTLEMTISHPSLPLGTQIRVTNPRNGKQISARVTGRIPATEGRIADLSRGVAEALELSSRARNPVVLEIVNERTPRPAPPPPEPEELPPEPEEPEPEELPPEPEEPEPEEAPPEPEEAPPPEPATEEPPMLPPHEDPVKGEGPEASPGPEGSPETEFVPGEDPQPPSVSTTDSKTQTTAPVSAQSPNITIYNVLQSPNSFATDSAPVNTGGSGAGAGAEGTQPQVPIIAAAPTASVSTSDRRSNSSDNSSTTNTTAPPDPESNKPAVATATAQIVAPVQQPQGRVQPVPVQPPAVQPRPAQPVQPQQPVQPAQPQQPRPQPVQPPAVQPQPVQPQPVQPPPIIDRGTAVIRPRMPDAGDSGKIYRVQVGSYRDTWHAREAFDRLTTVGFSPSYEGYGDYIRVVISGVPAGDMPSVARLLGRAGFTEALIREEN